MGNYLMQSVFELLETVLSYLSNTISFLRVGAFVIVHASMMMVVFTLAGTPNNIVVVILEMCIRDRPGCRPPWRLPLPPAGVHAAALLHRPLRAG